MGTSKLQIAVGNLLDKTFPQFHIRENYHPDWLISSNLTKLELDFYIEELKIAFEIQGDQHFRFIPYFHKDEAEFEKRKQYDNEKKDLCYGQDINLIEIITLMDAIITIKELEIKTIVLGLSQNNNPYIELPPRIPKKPKEKKIIKHGSIYRYQDIHQRSKTNSIGTLEDKLKEIKQFHKKFNKYSKNDNSDIPFFEFKILNLTEQFALLEEYGLLEKIYPEIYNS